MTDIKLPLVLSVAGHGVCLALLILFLPTAQPPVPEPAAMGGIEVVFAPPPKPEEPPPQAETPPPSVETPPPEPPPAADEPVAAIEPPPPAPEAPAPAVEPPPPPAPHKPVIKHRQSRSCGTWSSRSQPPPSRRYNRRLRRLRSPRSKPL